MSPTELHKTIMDEWFNAEEDESEETEEAEPEAIEAWERDVKKLVAEHDHQNWLMVSVIKLISLIKPRSSQFSYLNDIGYQT